MRGMRCASASFLFTITAVTLPVPAVRLSRASVPVASLPDAERAVNQGRADQAITMLRGITAATPNNGAAHLLLCRAFLSEERAEDAIPECESALTNLSSNSSAQDWMGRAYGMKASRSGALNGFVLARKVRDSFQAAVKLDPGNRAAVNDLSEYYIGAPSVVGGGLEKAASLATQVQGQLPQEAHRIRAMAAEKAKDPGTAEREFQGAVAVAHHANALADLGGFYARQGDGDRTVAAIKACVAAETAHDETLVDAATILNDAHREPQLAERLLRLYLRSPAQSDGAPAFRVHVLLGKMLLARGDKAAAKIEFGSALALASGYAPARNALHDI